MSSWVLDSSAVLAFLEGEPGSEVVRQALKDGAVVSTVNVAEVVTKLVMRGLVEAEVRMRIAALDLLIADFDADSAYRTGLLVLAGRPAGLSLGDRACLAFAEELGLPVLTADRAWQGVQVAIRIELIR